MQAFVASAIECLDVASHPSDADCAYQIAWALNPHTIVGSTNLVRAREQHSKLLRTVRGLGAAVVEVPFVHGAFDSVFTKDNALYVGDTNPLRVIMASPHHHERWREQAARAACLSARGHEVLTPSVPFEGGDVIVCDDLALLGYGFRSLERGVDPLAALLGRRVLALQLVDPYLYHLDTAMTVLSDRTALYCEEAFAPDSVAAIRDTFEHAIAVSRDDAAMFALNVVEVANTIVTGARCPAVDEVLRARGYQVVTLELDEFQRAGGSVSCLLAPIYTERALAQRSAA